MPNSSLLWHNKVKITATSLSKKGVFFKEHSYSINASQIAHHSDLPIFRICLLNVFGLIIKIWNFSDWTTGMQKRIGKYSIFRYFQSNEIIYDKIQKLVERGKKINFSWTVQSCGILQSKVSLFSCLRSKCAVCNETQSLLLKWYFCTPVLKYFNYYRGFIMPLPPPPPYFLIYFNVLL